MERLKQIISNNDEFLFVITFIVVLALLATFALALVLKALVI